MPKKDKQGKIVIKLTEEQYYWIIRFLNKEWSDEVLFRLDEGAHDTSYLEDLYDVYKALLGTPQGYIEATCGCQDLEEKERDLNEIRENG